MRQVEPVPRYEMTAGERETLVKAHDVLVRLKHPGKSWIAGILSYAVVVSDPR